MSTIARRVCSTALALTLATSGMAPSVAAEPVPQRLPTVAPAGLVPALAGTAPEHTPTFWCRIFRCWP
jgi:hypothetical protein